MDKSIGFRAHIWNDLIYCMVHLCRFTMNPLMKIFPDGLKLKLMTHRFSGNMGPSLLTRGKILQREFQVNKVRTDLLQETKKHVVPLFIRGSQVSCSFFSPLVSPQ